MLDILYRDADLIAIHKPAGLLVHRSPIAPHEHRFAVQLLRDQIGQRVYPAHRLDRGTSGVLLFALSAELASRLGTQFASCQVDKRYLAVVRGYPPANGTIDHPLSRQLDPIERRHGQGAGARDPSRANTLPEDDERYAETAGIPSPLSPDQPQRIAATVSQTAVTHYRSLATVELPYQVDRYPSSRYALVELSPQTGRRHQLRRHMKHIAHPIIGDATHGKGRHNRLFQTVLNSHRLLLACTLLCIDHPRTGARLRLYARPEPAFMAVIDALGWHTALEEALTAQCIASHQNVMI